MNSGTTTKQISAQLIFKSGELDDLDIKINNMEGRAFSVLSIRMRDAQTNEIFLDAPNWGEQHDGPEESEVRFPAKMLKSLAVGRMIVFSSRDAVEKLSLT